MNRKQGFYAAGKFIQCKGIIFDKDGTLIDIIPMLLALGKERCKHLSSRVKPEAVSLARQFVGLDIEAGKVEPYGPLASASWRDEIAVTACALWLSGLPWYQAYDLAKESLDMANKTLDVTEGVHLLRGVKESVMTLKDSGLSLFVATSDGKHRTKLMLDHVGLTGYFDLIVSADDVRYIKPSPHAVEICAASIGVSPEELAVVGDTPQDGIMGKNAGSKTIGVLSGLGTHKDLEPYFDVILPGVGDLKPA